MARNIDLTGKLGLEPKPTITIGDTVLTVDDSASNMLRIMELVGDGRIDAGTTVRIADMLFDKASRKALEKMALNFDDFSRLIEAALDLITGSAEGEAATPATT